jgi:pyridoxine 5-phosphate synthase
VQIEASAKAGARWSNFYRHLVRGGDHRRKLATAVETRRERGSQFAGARGACRPRLDFGTGELIATLPEIAELNIGHYLVGEAVFAGFDATIKNMLAAMARGREPISKTRSTRTWVGWASRGSSLCAGSRSISKTTRRRSPR